MPSTRPLQPAAPDRPRPSRRTLVLALATALALAVVAYSLVQYANLDPARSRVGLRSDVPVHQALLWAHIGTGAIALTLCMAQFSRRLRRRPGVHRHLGRVYLFAGVFPSSVLGIAVGLLSTQGPMAAAGLTVGSVAWLVTGARGLRAGRRREFAEHARWMTYNAALTLSAVTFRIWLAVLVVVQLPLLGALYGDRFEPAFHVAYALTCWLAFLPNLAVVALLRRR